MSLKYIALVLFLCIACIQAEETDDNFRFNSKQTSCPMLNENCHLYVAAKKSINFEASLLNR